MKNVIRKKYKKNTGMQEGGIATVTGRHYRSYQEQSLL